MISVKKRTGLLLAILVVLSGFGYLVYGGIGENLVLFRTPGELLAMGSEAYDRPIRLGGLVMPGSMQWDADAIDLRFTIQDQDGAVRVHSTKAPPAMFREGQGVIVEGRFTRDGVFESSTVLVKHSNEYRPPEEGHPDTEQMSRSVIRD